jgi:alpha-tubulin suppressor-like RCC1 family protein
VTSPDVNTSGLGASIFALGLGRISSGDSHSCGLTATNEAYCWGDNSTGQLGNGTSGVPSNVPVAVSTTIKFSSVVAGRIHTCGLSVTGDAYCWGSNFVGALGNGSGIDSLTPTAVTAPSVGIKYSSISASNDHTCVISLAKDAYCWGENGNGRLGDNSTTQRDTPVQVSDPAGGPEAYLSISAGYSHTCAITVSDKTYCWGDNSSGELGNASNLDSSIPVLVNTGAVAYTSIAAGNNFSCGIQANGSAYCWGSNGNGNLGNNSIIDSNTPVLVNDPIGGVVKYSSIVTGGFHTCAISLAGDAYCWGYNVDGELGNGANFNIAIPALVSPPSSGGILYSGLDVGTFHSCAFSTNGNAYCWGYGANGRLGRNSTSDSNIPTRDAATSLTL